MEQKKYDDLFSYVRKKYFPADFNKTQRDNLRRKSKSFVIKDGLLFFRDKKKNVDLQVRALLGID